MKKILTALMCTVLAAILSFSLLACTGTTPANTETPTADTAPVNTGTGTKPASKSYTVAFNVDGVRYKTLKVDEGSAITAAVDEPAKEGYSFSGWTLDGAKVVLSEYVVTGNVTFEAEFTKIDVNGSLNVTDVKQEGKEYYLVVGWWETTKLDAEGNPSHTSYLNEEQVRLFYSNLILYLKAKGATDADLAAVSVRNYSTDTVAEMGEKVLADGDVDLMIGVGNNVNSTAGLTLYESSNDNKFSTEMGTTQTGRYVALLSSTNELGVNVFDWLKTDTGRQAFKKQLTAAEITVVPDRSNEINLTVTVHGDTDVSTTLTNDETVIAIPAITVAEGFEFKGYAVSSDGEVVLRVALNEELTYGSVKSLVNVGDTELHLYPVIKESKGNGEPTKLNVYVQVQGTNLTEEEGNTLRDRFLATLTDEEKANVEFHIETVANAAAFTEIIDAAQDVDVCIGGNNPIDKYAKHEEGPTANAGAGHFANESRKIIICANTDNLELAKKLYAFVTSDYEEHTPEPATKLNVYVQVQGTNLTEEEGNTLRDRFLATLTDEEKANVEFHIETVSNGAAFTEIVEAAEDVDVCIGGNNPINNYEKHEEGPTANAGAGHFANESRKIIICANTDNLELAKKLYAFVTSDYTAD